MKKIIFFAVFLFMFLVSACGADAGSQTEQQGGKEYSASDTDKANGTAVSDENDVKEETMKITITINGNNKMTANLAGNSSAKAFFALLEKGAVTVKMHDYGNFEKVGELPESLPRNDTQITTEPGDIILYQGNRITIYYDTNSWNFTRLGKIDSITQAELKSILGEGDVTAVFEVKNEITE